MKTTETHPLPLKDVRIRDAFWSRYVDLIPNVVLRRQWELLNDKTESHCIENFRVAAGESDEPFEGMVFQDSDAAKWIEAAAYSLETNPDPELESTVDKLIALLGRAQQEDGYLDTYFTVAKPNGRWTNLLEGHELYIAGHFIEAAVAYRNATGKENLLCIVRRMADYICTVFGPEDGKLHGYPGHQEIELALVKLYHATGEAKYLSLAEYFIRERGKSPYYFDAERKRLGAYLFPEFENFDRKYNQTHLPPVEQTTAEGHAVRAMYMYSAMADLAFEKRDAALEKACERLFDNIASRRMYITGSVGSADDGERFTCDYDLPNDTNYSETCASVGLAMFCQRMLRNTHDGKYGDVLERALYNTVLSGISEDGQRFFYVNPLEVWPEACEKNPTKRHVKPERQKWFGCACCPPNVARTLASLGQYVYSASQDTLFVHIYLSNSAAVTLSGQRFEVSQQTNYPFEDTVRLHVQGGRPGRFTLALRLPAWSETAQLKIDGKPVSIQELLKDGYIYIDREWYDNRVEWVLDVRPHLVFANPKVRADAGRAAIEKGPLVYCVEECDNGENLQAVEIDTDVVLSETFEPELLGGTVVITCSAWRCSDEDWNDALYRSAPPQKRKVSLKSVPYCLWNNRGKGEMLVWLRTR